MNELTGVNAVSAVAELAKQVRQSTLKRLEVPEAALTWAPAGTSNHILWHAGHAVWLQDLLTIIPVTGRSELPDGWAAMFGQNSLPANTRKWPVVDELRSHLESQFSRILDLLTTKQEEITSDANRVTKETGWPHVGGMIHGWHDEARHQGEMYLLLKLFNKRDRSATGE
jgi:hypothetical protein